MNTNIQQPKSEVEPESEVKPESEVQAEVELEGETEGSKSKGICELHEQSKRMASELLRLRKLVSASGLTLYDDKEDNDSVDVLTDSFLTQFLGSDSGTAATKSIQSKNKTNNIGEHSHSSEFDIHHLQLGLQLSEQKVREYERQLERSYKELSVSKQENEELKMKLTSMSDNTHKKKHVDDKFMSMKLNLKEREEERMNIIMTIYNHELDGQQRTYVKSSIIENISKKEDRMKSLERELKLLRIEIQVKIREDEYAKLGNDLDKLTDDSQIFRDMADDLQHRLKEKNQCIEDMKLDRKLNDTSQTQLVRLNGLIVKEQEEQDHLVVELERLQPDLHTFDVLTKKMSEERSVKLTNLETYREYHTEVTAALSPSSTTTENDSVSSETTANDGSSGDDDVSSDLTMPTENRTTSTNGIIPSRYSRNISQVDLEMIRMNMESELDKCEKDKECLFNDLEQVNKDSQTFNDMTESLQEKLISKEDQIQKLKNEQEKCALIHRMQEKEQVIPTMEYDDY